MALVSSQKQVQKRKRYYKDERCEYENEIYPLENHLIISNCSRNSSTCIITIKSNSKKLVKQDFLLRAGTQHINMKGVDRTQQNIFINSRLKYAEYDGGRRRSLIYPNQNNNKVLDY